MLLAVDALEARTRAEYHRRIAQLPVTITESPMSGGLRRDFYVNNRLQLTVFVSSNPETTGGEAPNGAFGPYLPVGQAHGAPAFAAQQSASATFDYCEYTDDYGYWSGDCATEEDVDDAYATIAALDYDADNLEGEATSDSAAYCAIHEADDPQTCDLTHDVGVGATVSGSIGGGPSEVEEFNEPAPCPLRIDDSEIKFGCGGEAVDATYAAAAYVGAHAGALAIAARGAEATALELGGMVTALIAAGGALGYTVGSFINCLLD